MRRVLLAALICIALAGSGLPARAGPASWEDPAGDATAISIEGVAQESTPRPSDPELDIRAVSFALEGENIVGTASMKAGGFAAGSGGSVWRFYFSHKKNRYFFQAVAATAEYSQVFSSTPRFYRATPEDPTSNGEELKCDCKMTVDAKAGKVRFAIKTAAVAKPLKAAAGSIELTGLELRSYRRANFYLLADVAPAPAGTTFRA